MRKPLLLVVAGANGAGKTTFIRTQINFKEITEEAYVCPDLIAEEIRRENPELSEEEIYRRAMPLAEELRYRKLEKGEDIVLETVFSSGEKLLFLEKALERGYEVNMVYIATEDPRINAGRVARRVALGGHPVPPDKIYSRYMRSIENLITAHREGLLDRLIVADNSKEGQPHRPYMAFEEGSLVWLDSSLKFTGKAIISRHGEIPEHMKLLANSLLEVSPGEPKLREEVPLPPYMRKVRGLER